MLKHEFLPSIMFAGQSDDMTIKKALSECLGAPPANIFENEFPEDADFDEIFESGCFIMFHFKEGLFEFSADGFASLTFLSDESLFELSEDSSSFVCVDFSTSIDKPHFDGFHRGKKYEHLSVSERFDHREDPYYESEEVRQILSGKQAFS